MNEPFPPPFRLPPAGEGPGAPAGRVPSGCVVYVIGDVHGRADLLDRIHAAIRDNARRATAVRRVAVYLGDYIDRGPDSCRAVETLVRQPLAGFETVALKGNHEDLLLRFLDGDDEAGGHWLTYGGRDTLASYGIATPPAGVQSAAALAELRARVAGQMPASHLQFFRALKVRHREGNYLFVHAGVRPGVPIDAQSDRDLLWIGKRFVTSQADFGAIVVHGHCISTAPDVRHNRIGIDTGAYESGILTCLVLEGEQQQFLSTGP